MALGDPIDAWLQMARSKNQNRQQTNQDIAGIGQGLGDTFNSIGSYMQAQKKKQLLQQIVQAMQSQGAPQQGPSLPSQQGPQQPGQSFPPPASGIGGPAQDNTQQLKQMVTQYDPQGSVQQMEGQLFSPGARPQSLLQNAQTDFLKWKMSQNPQGKAGGTQGGWRAIQGRDGSAYLYNEGTGETRPIKGPMPPPQPKPVSPVPAAALDVKTQQLNNAQAPWWKKLLGQTPPIQNPLQKNQQPQSQNQGTTATGPNGQKIRWNGSTWVPQ